MARLRQILNAVVLAVAAIIAWNERRDPARSGGAPRPGEQRSARDEGAERMMPPAAPATGAPGTESTGLREAPGTASTPAVSAPPDDATPGGTVSPSPSPRAGAAQAERAGGRATGEVRVDAAPNRAQDGGGTGAQDAVPAGAVPGNGTPTCPPTHPIKGNAGSMIYHTPGRASYARTIAEFCFATEADAETAGYRPPRR